MLFSALLLPFLITLAKYGHLNTASSLFICYLGMMLSVLAWHGSGLHDPALAAYPGLFILAAILGKRSLFITLAGLIFLFILGFGYAEINGFFNPVIHGNTLSITTNLIIINAVLAACIWVLSSDMRELIIRINDENQRTRDAKEEAEHLANHDSLTELANRAMANKLLTQALSRAKRNHDIMALMFIDIDHFKHINDTLGHLAGDKLLQTIAKRLSASVRISDNVCRQGGDEFLLIIEGLHSETQTASLATKVLKSLAEPIKIGINDIVTTCSIGITLSPEDGIKPETLLKNADIAMYHAKEAGRNCIKFFDNDMNGKLTDYVSLAMEMRKAIQNHDLSVNYQAKIDLSNYEIIGAEALVRWNHPTQNEIPPDRFIPVAENSGLILEIGEWIIYQACKDCKSWHNEGYNNLVVAVNVSAIQFKRSNIPEIIYKALQTHQLDGHFLEIELTESLLLENDEHFNNSLRKISQLGVHISIDDFGTGYSNLAYLKQFEIGCLKIDQSFVMDLIRDKQSQSLVHAIIQLSKSLGLHTVAEGVEDNDTCLQLKEMGCESAQGFLWSQAVPNQDFLTLLAQKIKT